MGKGREEGWGENANFRAGEYVVATALGSQATGAFKLIKTEEPEPGKIRVWVDKRDDVSAENMALFLGSVRSGDQVSLMRVPFLNTRDEDQTMDVLDVPGVSVGKDKEGRVTTLTLPNVAHVTHIDKSGKMRWPRVADIRPNVERSKYAFVSNPDTDSADLRCEVAGAFYDSKTKAMTLNVRDLSPHKKKQTK